MLSVHQAPPFETGGVEARAGFAVQDHVNVSYCLDLISNSSLKQVWCENQDDITLIWDINAREKVEFVQVKSGELDQLWSLPKICERKKIGDKFINGSSIIEKSLQYDRFSELCCFRIVTTRPVNNELKVLTYPTGSVQRNNEASELVTLASKLKSRLGDFKSPKNNSFDYWLSNTYWQEVHSLESLKNANTVSLNYIAQSRGYQLLSDQLQNVYETLLSKVYLASMASWYSNPDNKKFTKQTFTAWFNEKLEQTINPVPIGIGNKIRYKMTRANIPDDAIATAIWLQRKFKKEILTPKYLDISDIDYVEAEVIATLQNLRSKLDSGLLNESGLDFHAECLKEISKLKDELGRSDIPLSIFQGCMYNVVDRCLHRFLRAET